MPITQVITTLPTAPDPLDPATFSARAAAYVLAQKEMVPEINAWAAQVNAIVSGTAGDIASGINGATAKTTPVDADLMCLTDSAASFVLKKLTWANLKSALIGGTQAGAFTTLSAGLTTITCDSGGNGIKVKGRNNAAADEGSIEFVENDGTTTQGAVGGYNGTLSFYDKNFILRGQIATTGLAVTGLISLTTDLQLPKTITTTGTTGAQTINKLTGSVNFAAAAASLVVANSFVDANSIIQCTIGTNDATMKSVQAIAAAGSFTIYPNAVPTAETRVNFRITN